MSSLSIQARVKGSIPLRIALYLTLARIVISPIFLIIYANYHSLGLSFLSMTILLIILLTLSELSDFLDGFIARRWNQVTDLGKILDPMADSIARISVFLTFTQGVIQLPLLLVFVFLYRDVFISMLRTLCALRGVTLAARTSGKIKAVIQAIAAFIILVLMLPYAFGKLSLISLQSISFYVVAVAAVYTLFSGIEYIYANRYFIKQAWDRAD